MRQTQSTQVPTLLTLAYVLMAAAPAACSDLVGADQPAGDRLWSINTRHLASEPCGVDLQQPSLRVSRLTCSGHSSNSSLDEYFQAIGEGRKTVVYVHGNRLEADEAIARALAIYRRTRGYRRSGPIDWVVWNWPSEREGILVHDFRRKADRADAQGLYLSWVLQRHAEANVPTALIAYSFGARVVTGALHVLAGGQLGGRRLSGEPVIGCNFDAGLVAPAIEDDWMALHGRHGLATKNLDRMVLLYNRRDAVLKRYWWLDRVHGTMALGYTGPRSFAPRADGSRLPVRARDCSTSVGKRHVELEYYESTCTAGPDMGALIDDVQTTH